MIEQINRLQKWKDRFIIATVICGGLFGCLLIGYHFFGLPRHFVLPGAILCVTTVVIMELIAGRINKLWLLWHLERMDEILNEMRTNCATINPTEPSEDSLEDVLLEMK